jgi:bla regulator protein BlaR1
MITYLINFVLCSGLLLLVYRLFLQNERMYRFNRFYLLFSLLFSLAVPFITIQSKITVMPVVEQPVHIADSNTSPVNSAPTDIRVTAKTIEHFDWTKLAIGAYVLIAVVLLGRFLVNLYRISRTVAQNETVAHQHTNLILTDDNVTPHSFLKYVFVNRSDYLDGAVEPQIICHEETHVRQLHSLDVILVELLQAVCWFNLFIPFYRRAIQLNHEFLADEAVIDHSHDTVAYQYLLLAKASQNNSLQLTSQFNYLTTKKRLLMMTKTTSAKMALGKQLVMLPVVAVAVMLFSQKTTATILPRLLPQLVVKETPVAKKDTVKHVKFHHVVFAGMRTKYSATDAPDNVMNEYASILKKYDIPDGKASNISAADKDRLHALFIQMSKDQQDGQQFRFTKAFKPVAKNTVTADQLKKWQNNVDFGVWVDGKRVKNAALANYQSDDFDHMFFSNLMPYAIKNDGFRYQIDLMTKSYYAEYYKTTMANQADRIDYWHVMKRNKK